MLKRSTTLPLALICLIGTAASVLSQTAATAQPADKIKAKVTKIGLRNEITVTLTNLDIYHGSVDNIGDDTFKIDEVDLQKVLEFKYAEVKKATGGTATAAILMVRDVSSGFGRKSKIALIATGAVLGFLVICAISGRCIE